MVLAMSNTSLESIASNSKLSIASIKGGLWTVPKPFRILILYAYFSDKNNVSRPHSMIEVSPCPTLFGSTAESCGTNVSQKLSSQLDRITGSLARPQRERFFVKLPPSDIKEICVLVK